MISLDSKYPLLSKILRTCALLTALLGLSHQALGQSASLRGLVTDAQNGSALVSANVILFNLEGERAGASATNVDGYFEISGLSPGRYQIRVSYVGYKTQQDTIALDEGRRTYNVSLQPTEKQLEGIKVEAERGAAQRQAGLQKVGAADLGRIPTPGPSGDLAAYLQTLPGVMSVGNRGGQVYIRGGTPSQNLVLVDGLRVINPFHISNMYSAFPEEVVKTADIFAGGFGAEYMGSISSVIDVSLRRGNMKEYVGSASISPFITSARVEGPIEEGQSSFLGVVRRSLIRQTANPLINKDVPIDFYDITARYTLQKESSVCNITALHTSDAGQINPNRQLELSWSNSAVGGRCLFFNENLNNAIELTTGYTRFKNTAGTPNSPERSAGVNKIYLNLETERSIFGNQLNFGGRLVFSDYSRVLNEKFTKLESVTQSGGALQAYASMKLTAGDWLTVTPSIGSHLTARRFSSPSFEPRLRLSVRPTGTSRREISIAVGKYNQVARGLTDERDAGTVFTVWKPSGADQKLLEALHGILGYQHNFGSFLEVSLEGYLKDLRNIPVPKWSTVARFNTRTTLANGLAYGADARIVFNKEPVYAYVGYGWSKVKYEAARRNLGAWAGGEVVEYNPPHDRRHQVNVVASYEIADYTVNASWEFGSGRPYTKVYGFDLKLELPREHPATSPGTARTLYSRPYGARLPPYHKLDLSVERSFDLSSRTSLEAKLGAVNLYDRQNIFYYDINTLKRVNQTPLLPYFSLRVQLN